MTIRKHKTMVDTKLSHQTWHTIFEHFVRSSITDSWRYLQTLKSVHSSKIFPSVWKWIHFVGIQRRLFSARKHCLQEYLRQLKDSS